MCGGRGFRRLPGKTGRVPGAGRDPRHLGKVAVCQECGHSVRRAPAPDGLERHSLMACEAHLNPPRKPGLLSSFTRACLGGSGHLELGGVLHRNKHSEGF